jgi:hypothetical protein
MAYFSETKEVGEFVAPGLQPYILEGRNISKDDIFIVRFLFLGYEHKIIADKQFVTKHAIANEEVFDLEATGKEAVFLELIPVPQSLYLEFLKKNNIEV